MSGIATPSRPSKRARINERNPFIDLEADVANEGEEDDDDVPDAYINDSEDLDDSDLEANRLDNRRMLLQGSEDLEDGFLGHMAEKYSNTSAGIRPLGMEKYLSISQGQTTGDCELWEVPTQPGHEYSTVLHILKRVELYEYARFGVRSVFAHESCPGRILVEVASSIGVVGVCNGIPHVFANKWKVVPRETTLQYLKLRNDFIPSPHSWIKLQCRGYRNDIGFVSAVHENGLDVIVVPRIVYERTGKRRRGPTPKQRLDVVQARSSGHIELKNNIYTFKGRRFTACGYLLLELQNSFDYTRAEIFPSKAQLEEFRACELIPNSLMAQFITRANSPLLNAGDRVRIITGDLKGVLAEVMTIRDADMDVFVLDDGICTTIPNHFAQKIFRVGNQIVAKFGPHKNIIGWVVEVHGDTLTVADNANKTRQVELLSSDVDHYTPDFTILHANSDKPVEELNFGMNVDPYKHLKGEKVKIIGAVNFKAYEGLLKEVRDDGTAVVEIQAHLAMSKRTENIKTDNVSILRHGTWTPLMEALSTVAGPSNRPVPLPKPPHVPTPSTPFPSSPVDSTSPAWCASSRTPYWSSRPSTPLATDNPTPGVDVAANSTTSASVARNSWLWPLMNPTTKAGLQQIDGRSPRVLIIGTQPSPGNLGFRNGSLEGMGGTFIKFQKPEEATIRVLDKTNSRVASELDIPTKFLQPEPPTGHSQRVFVIEKGKIFGKAFSIMGRHEPGVWRLTAPRGRNNGKDLHHIRTEHLVQYTSL